ncbi:sigma-54-dependent Fis family transcriptional regulator [Pseudonocardia sp. N23]|uniref:sigma-54-dependent Fis family transcriptional regulator n=1 Tax=Pseudonocardia sp. N23 TaxID=1987376 RepID=UPI000BFE942E|nr:helix-turn-helix domain-containing protein [Pseudonocardia sp. N23]GAY08072.1 nitrogen regulation protein NtrC [Pseudonocardia sp. N23]
MRRDEVRNLPALSSAERELIRSRREALVGGGLLSAPPGAAGVPQHIEKSWRRCIGDKVPAAATDIGYRDPGDALPALRRAAGPVFERLRDSFAEVPVAMVLADAEGRIVMRHVPIRRQRDVMDRASAAEGFDFSERSIGTNGIGTVLIERKPVLVRGPEHYSTLLEQLTCAGTPIVEPYTGRLVGSFSLASSLRDVHPLMTVMAGDIGRQIEDRILDEAGDRHRGLVRAYLALDRVSGPALVVDDDTVLANRPGLAHTGPELHAVLWQYLSEHATTGPGRMRVPLADGLHDALVEPIDEGGRRAFSVRPLPHRAPSERRSGPRPPHAPLHDDPAVHRELEVAVRHGETLAVTGAAGTGKLRTALRALRERGAGDPLVAEPQLDPGWFDAARSATSTGRAVIVRRVHADPVPSAAQLQALIDTGAPVALTADLDAADDDALAVVRRVATTVRLPSLDQRRERIPALVRATLAALPEPESATTLSAAVWERLAGWRWPGNLAELDMTVRLLARRARGRIVEVDDLPDELRTARPTSGLMESAERDAVAEALRAAEGNRSRAAAALGIGRNTLYRKMREFGLT